MFNRPPHCDSIFLPQKLHYGVTPFTHSMAKLKEGKDRCNHNREDQRAQESERNSPGHGLEQTPLDALQREDRQISGDDDSPGIKYGPEYFAYCAANALQR